MVRLRLPSAVSSEKMGGKHRRLGSRDNGGGGRGGIRGSGLRSRLHTAAGGPEQADGAREVFSPQSANRVAATGSRRRGRRDGGGVSCCRAETAAWQSHHGRERLFARVPNRGQARADRSCLEPPAWLHLPPPNIFWPPHTFFLIRPSRQHSTAPHHIHIHTSPNQHQHHTTTTMAKGLRSSTKKTNRTKLRARVFEPVEAARLERLSQKLLETAAQPKPETAKDKEMDVDGNTPLEPSFSSTSPLTPSPDAANSASKEEDSKGSCFLTASIPQSLLNDSKPHKTTSSTLATAHDERAFYHMLGLCSDVVGFTHMGDLEFAFD